MFYHENAYLNYHLTTIVNFDKFTFCGTILSNDVIEISNWFYFLSNALCYIQIKFRYQGRNQGGLRELKPPPPLSQVEVEKKDKSFNF